MGYLQKICDYAVKGIEGENEIYTSEKLIESCANIIRPSMSNDEIRNSVIQISLELTTDSEPKWQYVASKLYIKKLYDDIRKNRGLEEGSNVYDDFYGFISAMTEKKLYG
ncbi:ribonucleoside-diphosphate reductase subunit alpha, partial [Clostridium saudiense]|nr:ribonucleoside-diphosphate reductase subunit alpha [Clostridium saudiense]